MPPRVGRTTLGLSPSDRHLTHPFPLFLPFFPAARRRVRHGILNRGKAQKREKRPPTQIEILAAQEREKQEKKAARKAAKVSNPTFPGPARSPDRRVPH